VLSVLVYPLIAVGLYRSAPLSPTDLGITPAETAAGTGASPEIPGPPGQDGHGALAAAISAGSKPSTTGTATATAAIISTPLNEIAPRHPAEMLSLVAGMRQLRNRVPVSVYRPRALNAWFGHAVAA